MSLLYRNNAMVTVRITETDHRSPFEPNLTVTQGETAQQPKLITLRAKSKTKLPYTRHDGDGQNSDPKSMDYPDGLL